MKKRKYIFFSIPFYSIALLTLSLLLFAAIYPGVGLRPSGRMFLCCIFCLCLYLGSRILCKSPGLPIAGVMRLTFFTFFVVYASLLLRFTLLDPMFGRSGKARFIFSDRALLQTYLENSVNLLPFSTIWKYGTAFFTGSESLSAIVTNLLGNLLALTPLGLFLPMFLPTCRKFGCFLCTAAGIVLGIELLQFVFVTGACDIDDLILNVSGACLAYGILHSKPIGRLLPILIPTPKEERL